MTIQVGERRKFSLSTRVIEVLAVADGWVWVRDDARTWPVSYRVVDIEAETTVVPVPLPEPGSRWVGSGPYEGCRIVVLGIGSASGLITFAWSNTVLWNLASQRPEFFARHTRPYDAEVDGTW